MSDTEDYLELESIIDSCIVDDGKQWYNVKWKTAWLLHEELPEQALKDYHSTKKKGKTCQEKIYSILEEKIDDDGRMKYLLCSINTWEPEEKLARLYPLLLSSYWSENASSNEILKIHDRMVGFKKSKLSGNNAGKDNGGKPNDPDNMKKTDEKQNVTFKLKMKLMSKFSGMVKVDGANGSQDSDTKAEEKQFKCVHCGKEFLRANSLKMHMRTHTGEKPYECSECGKCFSQKGTLTVHMRSHTGERPFKCWYCDRTFSCHHYLKSHMCTHTGEKAHKCKHCGKMFTQKGSLTVHIRTHTGEKPFKCIVCGKQFSSQQYLKLHMTTHSDEKPFHCDTCMKHFVRSDSLKLHMRTHNDKRPFQCKLCEKTFKSSYHLKMHSTIHSNEKAFPCDQCEKVFPHKPSLMRHIKSHKKEISEDVHIVVAVDD